MNEEITSMKNLILQNQKMIEILSEKVKKLEAELLLKNTKVMRLDNTKALSPAEIVGHNMDVMKLIINKISSDEERKNIELTCKAYYLLCNSPNSYLPLVGYEADKYSFSKWQEKGGFTFFIHNDEIEITIPETFFFNDTNSTVIKGALEKYIPKMKTLYIMKLFPQHIEFFKKLNCFQNIEIIKFSRYALQINAGEILEKCQNLKPLTLIANNDHISSYNIRSLSPHENNLKFPPTLKNIHYDCYSEDFMWLLSSMKGIEIRNFDNLVITKEMIDFLHYDEMELAYLKFITFFKSVNYYANDFICSDFDRIFGRTLAQHNIAVSVNIHFESNILGLRRYVNLLDQRDQYEFRRNILNNKNSRFLANPGVYHNIRSLIIFDLNFSRFYYPFTYTEVQTLSQDLAMMNSLITLEISFNLIPDYSSFYQICSALGKRLKNLRMYYCGKMGSSHFDILSENCTGLKNLSLISLKFEVTSIDKIISLFKDLKGLEVEFQKCKIPFVSTWECLGLDDDDYKLKWPEVNFLRIICNLKNYDEHTSFEKMERNTPRKSGRLFLRKFHRDEETFIEIIIQKSASNCDTFDKIFTKR
uniref:F-box domain-containing protein n=1 Tax=Strongyloides venezuelensis TaxID=75913 RepID=A0A0K0FMS6_STRVS